MVLPSSVGAVGRGSWIRVEMVGDVLVDLGDLVGDLVGGVVVGVVVHRTPPPRP